MEDYIKKKLMAEIGLDNQNYIDEQLPEITKGTAYERAAKTVNSVFFTIIKKLFRSPYQIFIEAIRAMLPQLFVETATDSWLERFANDYDLERGQGVKSQQKLLIKKSTEGELRVSIQDIFFVNEQIPRRFIPVSNYEFSAEMTDCYLIIEAEEIGAEYNVLPGQISECEAVLPLNSIENTEAVVTGEGVESDELLRARIKAKRLAGNIFHNIEYKFTAALESVEHVQHAVLSSVDNTDATLYFTVYGEGILGADVITACNQALENLPMATDKAVVSAAVPDDLALTVQIDATYIKNSVLDAIQKYFSELPKGDSYEATLLAAEIVEHIPDLKDKKIRINPAWQDLSPTGFFRPSVTFKAWGT